MRKTVSKHYKGKCMRKKPFCLKLKKGQTSDSKSHLEGANLKSEMVKQ